MLLGTFCENINHNTSEVKFRWQKWQIIKERCFEVLPGKRKTANAICSGKGINTMKADNGNCNCRNVSLNNSHPKIICDMFWMVFTSTSFEKYFEGCFFLESSTEISYIQGRRSPVVDLSLTRSSSTDLGQLLGGPWFSTYVRRDQGCQWRKNNVLSAKKQSNKLHTAVSVAFSYLLQCRVKTGGKILFIYSF